MHLLALQVGALDLAVALHRVRNVLLTGAFSGSPAAATTIPPLRRRRLPPWRLTWHLLLLPLWGRVAGGVILLRRLLLQHGGQPLLGGGTEGRARAGWGAPQHERAGGAHAAVRAQAAAAARRQVRGGLIKRRLAARGDRRQRQRRAGQEGRLGQGRARADVRRGQRAARPLLVRGRRRPHRRRRLRLAARRVRCCVPRQRRLGHEQGRGAGGVGGRLPHGHDGPGCAAHEAVPLQPPMLVVVGGGACPARRTGPAGMGSPAAGACPGPCWGRAPARLQPRPRRPPTTRSRSSPRSCSRLGLAGSICRPARRQGPQLPSQLGLHLSEG